MEGENPNSEETKEKLTGHFRGESFGKISLNMDQPNEYIEIKEVSKEEEES